MGAMWRLATGCATETTVGSTPRATPPSAPAPKPNWSVPPVAAGCDQKVGDTGVEFLCNGYTASKEIEPPAAPRDPEAALDALMHDLAGPMAPVVQKFGAKIREAKFDLRLAGNPWRGAKVLAVHPSNEGQYYGACFAAMRERVAIVCCASTGDGMSKCPSMMEFLAGFGER